MMNNNVYKIKFNQYLNNSQSHYYKISCNKKDECKDYKCIEGKCNKEEAQNIDDMNSIYDFDTIKETFCNNFKVEKIGSCDGIVFLDSNQIVLIEFKLGCKSFTSICEKAVN